MLEQGRSKGFDFLNFFSFKKAKLSLQWMGIKYKKESHLPIQDMKWQIVASTFWVFPNKAILNQF